MREGNPKLREPESFVMGGKQAFCEQPTLRLLKAAQTCNLLVMDSLLSLGMSPRIATAINELNEYKAHL